MLTFFVCFFFLTKEQDNKCCSNKEGSFDQLFPYFDKFYYRFSDLTLKNYIRQNKLHWCRWISKQRCFGRFFRTKMVYSLLRKQFILVCMLKVMCVSCSRVTCSHVTQVVSVVSSKALVYLVNLLIPTACTAGHKIARSKFQMVNSFCTKNRQNKKYLFWLPMEARLMGPYSLHLICLHASFPPSQWLSCQLLENWNDNFYPNLTNKLTRLEIPSPKWMSGFKRRPYQI